MTSTELIKRAHETLPPPVWDYVAGSAETETSYRRNRQAISSYAFRARVGRDVSKIDTSTSLLGTKLSIPVVTAPVGSLQTITPDGRGGASSVKVAADFGSLAIVSSVCQPDLETCAAAHSGPKYFQLYIRGNFDWIAGMVRRVEKAGYSALVLTLDTAVYSIRERQVHRRWLPPSKKAEEDRDYQPMLDWDTIAKVKAISSIPIILKGIQTAEDAEIALQLGIDAIYVSNHGGRQLDHSRGTMMILDEVSAAIGNKSPIIVDGAMMRGNDVVKAIALGATAVGIGRLHAWGLAAGGEDGLRRVFEILENEIRVTMALIGVTSLAQIDRSYLAAVPPMDDTQTAFPTLPIEIRV